MSETCADLVFDSGETYIATLQVNDPNTDMPTILATTTITILEDHEPPVIVGPKMLNVTIPFRSTVVPVSFSVTATDAKDGVVSVSCDPTSGSRFELGTTTVVCNAQDAAGQEALHTFEVSVTHGFGEIVGVGGSETSTVKPGDEIRVRADGFGSGSIVRIDMRSNPVRLAEVTADAMGQISAVVSIPRSMPAGDHTLIAVGTDPSGAERMVVLPIVVTSPSDTTGAIQPVGVVSVDPAAEAKPATQPRTPLAHTGTASILLVQLGLLLFGTGLTLAGVRRRQH